MKLSPIDKNPFVVLLSDCLSTLLNRSDINRINETILSSRTVDWPVVFTSPENSFSPVLSTNPLSDKWDDVTALFMLTISDNELSVLIKDIERSILWHNVAKDEIDSFSKPISIKSLDATLTDSPRIMLFYLVRFLELVTGE